MPKISKDKTLADLSPIDKAHWKLHLNAALKDNPSLKAEIEVFTKGGGLPNLRHPADVHDWFEKPDKRAEVYNG